MCLLVLYVFGGETGGILGNLNDRTCKFLEKLNPVTTCRITIFEACSVKNLCLHLRCSEGRALFSFSVQLTYVLWIHKKRLREKQREKKIDTFILSPDARQGHLY